MHEIGVLQPSIRPVQAFAAPRRAGSASGQPPSLQAALSLERPKLESTRISRIRAQALELKPRVLADGNVQVGEVVIAA